MGPQGATLSTLSDNEYPYKSCLKGATSVLLHIHKLSSWKVFVVAHHHTCEGVAASMFPENMGFPSLRQADEEPHSELDTVLVIFRFQVPWSCSVIKLLMSILVIRHEMTAIVRDTGSCCSYWLFRPEKCCPLLCLLSFLSACITTASLGWVVEEGWLSQVLWCALGRDHRVVVDRSKTFLWTLGCSNTSLTQDYCWQPSFILWSLILFASVQLCGTFHCLWWEECPLE